MLVLLLLVLLLLLALLAVGGWKDKSWSQRSSHDLPCRSWCGCYELVPTSQVNMLAGLKEKRQLQHQSFILLYVLY